MGWIFNAPTDNRWLNQQSLLRANESLNQDKHVFVIASRNVQDQAQRGAQLSVQAFTVYGASSELGQMLQVAVNELNTCVEQSAALASDLQERESTLTMFNRSFNVPRILRNNSTSGKIIAESSQRVAADFRTNLRGLVRQRATQINEAVQVLDYADLQLNNPRGPYHGDFLRPSG